MVSGLTFNPTGETAPGSKPQMSRINVASAALPLSPAITAMFLVSTLLPPEATTSTAWLLFRVTKISDFAIYFTSQPMSAAASAAVWVLLENSTTLKSGPSTL